jgi:hypothetical protein
MANRILLAVDNSKNSLKAVMYVANTVKPNGPRVTTMAPHGRDRPAQIKSMRNPNLKLGKVKDAGNAFEAEILTKNNSLVDKVLVDKSTRKSLKSS